MKVVSWVTFWFLLFSCRESSRPKDSNLVARADTLDIGQIDTMKIETASVASYNRLTDYAIRLYADTANEKHRIKGSVLLAVTARHLEQEIADKNLDPTDSDVIELLKRYETYQYFIYQPKMPDLIKAAHLACEGDYGYILSRFRVKWYYYPSLVLVCILAIFYLLNLFRLIKWRYRKTYTIFFSILIVLSTVACIVFKKSCNKYVTPDSFYGAHF